MRDTQWAERTRLARERSMLAIVAISALLAVHGHAAFGIVSGLFVAAVGLAAVLASACAAVALVL